MLGISLLAVRAVLAAGAFAQAPAPTLTAQPAFDGWVQPGGWSAVAVDVDNPGAEWRGQLEVGGDEVLYKETLTVPGGGHKKVWVPVRQPRQNGLAERSIDLRSKDGAPASARFRLKTLSPNDTLLALLSDDSLPTGGLAHASSPYGNGNVSAVQLRTADLPAHRKAFGAVSAVFAARWQTAALSPEQVEALRLWVAGGGLLVISPEPDLARLQAPWLAPLLPASAAGDARLDVLGALHRHTGLTPEPQRLATPPWSVKLSPRPGSTVLLRAGAEPLAVCGRSGLGAVCLLAFDFSDPAFAAYDGWTHFALELVGLYVPKVPMAQYEDPRLREAPFAQALEEALGKVSLPTNAGSQTFYFALCYVLVLLPGNYFAFRTKKRSDDAWAGMLVIIGLSTALAWGLGRSRQAAVATQGLLIVRSAPGIHEGALVGWIGQFSGERRTRSIPLPPDAQVAEEIKTIMANSLMQAGLMPGGVAAAQAQPMTLTASEEGRALEVQMEAGSLRSFRVEGQRPIGEGLSLDWTEEAGERGLRWTNKTGLDFTSLFVATTGSLAAEKMSRSAAQGASGFLAFSSATRMVPLSTACGDALSQPEQKILASYLEGERRDCPSCAYVIGLTAPARDPRRQAAPPTAYVWPVRDAAGNLLAGRRLFLDTQQYRGNWNYFNQKLSLNSGQITLEVPVGDGIASEGSLAVKLQGQWASDPLVEVFDREKGAWVAEPRAAAPASSEGEVRLPEAKQAALALSPIGQAHAALVTAQGSVLLAKLDGSRVLRSVLDAAADPVMAPALAFDVFQKPHVVYRKHGQLYHAVEGPGAARGQAVPGSKGASAAALGLVGGRLTLAFVVPGKGAFASELDARGWTTNPIAAEAAAQAPVALTDGAGEGAFVCYSLAGRLDCASGSGASWTRSPGGATHTLPLKTLQLAPPSSATGGRIQGLAVNDGLVGGWQVERLYGFSRRMRGAGGFGGGPLTTWSHGSVPMSQRAVAGALASVQPGLGYGNQQIWGGLLTEGGSVLLLNPNGMTTTLDVRDAKPPFGFSVDPSGAAFWLYHGPRGLVLRREPDRIRSAMASIGYGGYGGVGGHRERLVTFAKAGRFIWEEVRAGRVRLTSQGVASLDSISYQAAP